MHCAAEAVMLNSDGKAPDTAETALYFGAFALWIIILTHLAKTGKKECSQTTG